MLSAMTQCLDEGDTSHHGLFIKKILSAVFYGVASLMITIVNKTVLTSYAFPSFQVLGLGQMAATIIVLYAAKKLKFISFADFGMQTFWKIWPLPVIYMGNMLFGLGGTKELSLPMFTVLRRFSILITMIAELFILGVRPSFSVQCSVYMMVFGAVLAASNDLSFNLEGYVFVLLNNFFTAANGVYTKKKLDSKELGKYGLIFYNSLIVIVPTIIFTYITGELEAAYNFKSWGDTLFLAEFLLSCMMGFILMYSVVLCTFYNSALTTTITGSLKNISVTYLGMVVGGDYIFSWLNFVGLNLSVLGSAVYTYVTFRKTKQPVYTALTAEKSSKVDIV